MEKVTVFSRGKCVQCNATYRALDDNGIEFEVVDVDEDEATQIRLQQLGFQQLPVVHPVGVPAWSGFRPDKISELAAMRSDGAA